MMFQEGDRGYLEGLASRYADLFRTHYGDVLDHLEDLRRREWADLSPRIRVLGTGSSGSGSHLASDGVTPESPVTPGGDGAALGLHQPIYVPGKYSPSSCLSDKEEDEIYGFAGYGVYGKQMIQRQQATRVLLGAQAHANTLAAYQTCLSPRSAYFYEFPPNEHATGHHTCKKKTPFSRLLRGLKTSHRKDKDRQHHHHQQQLQMGTLGASPRRGRGRPLRQHHIYSRVTTPDGESTLQPHLLDPRDYDRLHFLQLNGAARGFEETIHRLKVQEALKQKERYHKENEEILRDIRQGLIQLGREPGREDDTYMYDTELRCPGPGGPSGPGAVPGAPGAPAHWYDEPPYESDPEDFLMGAPCGAAATIRNGRVCFTLNLRPDVRGEGVISLRTAGDISVGGPASGSGSAPCPRRGLLLPQSGPYPAALIPLSQATARDGTDYISSDVQSLSSRISNVSVDTARSEQRLDLHQGILFTPTHHVYRGKQSHAYRCRSSQSEGTLSPCRSPDVEESPLDTRQLPTEAQPRGISLVGRMRGLRQDVQRKISRLRAMGAANSSSTCGGQADTAIPLEPLPSASSLESLPSGSGSSTQPLVQGGSNHSSLSPEDCNSIGLVIGKARALVDYTPSPYDKDALKIKKGDIIDVLSMNASGLWRGALNGRVGHFKFINVELVPSVAEVNSQAAALKNLLRGQRHPARRKEERSLRKWKPRTVEELLRRVNLEECISVFVLNGYEDMNSFRELREEDLDYLGIKPSDTRAKIRAAVQLLHDYDSESNDEREMGGLRSSNDEGDGEEEDGEDSSGSDLSGQPTPLPLMGKVRPPGAAFQRLHFPRDSGCYDADASRESPSRWSSRHSHSHSHSKHRDGREGARHSRRANNLDGGKVDLASPAGDPPPAPAPASAPSAAAAASGQHEIAELQGYHPNIPVRTSIDSYVVARGKVVSVEPCLRVVGQDRSASAHGKIRRASPASPASETNRSPVEINSSPLLNIEKSGHQLVQCVSNKVSTNSEFVHHVLESVDKKDEMSLNSSSLSFGERHCTKGINLNGSMHSEEIGGQDPKLTYPGEVSCEVSSHVTVSNGNGISGVCSGPALSEKSSDSGVSSSSISSTHPVSREVQVRKDRRNISAVIEAAGQ